MKLSTYFKPFININSKLVISLNIKYKMMKFLEDNTRKTVHDHGYIPFFRYKNKNKKQVMKDIMSILDFIKIKKKSALQKAIGRKWENESLIL